jgi:penicillin amidase
MSFATHLVLPLAALTISGAFDARIPEAMASTQTALEQGSVSFFELDFDGEQAMVVRDVFWVPHIFAPSNRSLFAAYGYTVAEDRLWQLELNRRAARGRLAEILGPSAVPADRVARIVGYTDDELDAQFARLSPEEQDIFFGYRDGINRYLDEVVFKDLIHKLPYEFHVLGFMPAHWEARDSVAFSAFMTRRFGEIGGRELINQGVLTELVERYGSSVGLGIFNDLRWINDPQAPVTIPPQDARSPNGRTGGAQPRQLSQLLGSSERWPDTGEMAAQEIWQRLGVVTKLGSYAWAIRPEKSARGSAMLYGGPQMGYSAPEVLHEVQLTGGAGFNVMGMAFAGAPAVLIGRNEHLAWTSTTATGDNVDTYIETLCGVNQYRFKTACIPMESRLETIQVRGADPVPVTVLRTVHGPVVAATKTSVATQKRAHWQREIESFRAFMNFGLAQNLSQFAAAIPQIVTSHNFLYADRLGNIAYWQAGQVPVRPAGSDPRLPLSGDGSAEWPGGNRPIPTSINPAQGFLANWNNKPQVDYPNSDGQILGKQFRLLDLQDALASAPISFEDMENIPKDIARFGSLGREARYLEPYLLRAVAKIPPSHPLSRQAIQILEEWDGNQIDDAIDSTLIKPGEVIFSTWLARMIHSAFDPVLGRDLTQREASSNMLLHVLDDALGSGSGVPPSRNYFQDRDPSTVISATFNQALADLESELGSDPSAWVRPRPVTTFDHPVVGRVGTIPTSNRATYGQIVVLDPERITSENIFTLGQSGFIQLVPPAGFALDPHFRDQLELYRNFEYKPMRLMPFPRL